MKQITSRKRNERVTVRIAGSLRLALEELAAEERRSLADKVRLVLVDYCAGRAVEHEQRAA